MQMGIPGDGGFDYTDPSADFLCRDAFERARRRAMRNSDHHGHNHPHQPHQPPPLVRPDPHHLMMPPPTVIPGLEMAWVLVFNAGRPNEEAYTHMQPGEAPAVLAFESTEDANAFVEQMLAEGFDPATPLCWGAGQLTRFSQATGLEVVIVPRGNLPPLPQTFDRSAPMGLEAPERHPWRGEPRPDPYTAYRMRLEAIFPRKPDNCSDDDCTLPKDEQARGHLRQQAMDAIEAILAAHGDEVPEIDVAALLKGAWEKAEAEKRDMSAEDEGQ
jgi:hypothetical protein